MKSMKPLIIALLVFYLPGSLYSQKIIRNSSVTSVSYAGSGVTRMYIPPPGRFFNMKGGKGASITVYYSGFSSASRAAFQYAVSILSSLLPDDASFTVRATFGPLAEESVLGSTTITSYSGGAFIDALNPRVYYPVALAEKIYGQKLNTDLEGDVTMTINSRVPWYYGTDGNTPVSSYDMVTVVLHELVHGIGFADSFNSANSLGSYGLNSVPLIFDSFIEDRDGYLLTDRTKYNNNSAELNLQLLGGQLYFNGPLMRLNNLGQRARLYAPSTWDPGSSIAHLNENTYNSSKNALLTPFLDKGEAIHSPGDIAMGILGDMGWINTRITHTPLKDTESNLTSVLFKASIRSDTTFNRDLAGLTYSFNNSTVKDTLYLVPPAEGDTFRIELPVPSYNTLVRYYFFATDRFGRNYKMPSLGESEPYSFFIGTDTVKPVIKHMPVKFIFEKAARIRIDASASDNIGVDTVYIEYRKNILSSQFVGLSGDSLNKYGGYIELHALDLNADDSISYRIVAEDKSQSGNKSYLPSSGFFTVGIETPFPAAEAYSTDFSSASLDFVNRGFSILTPPAFTSPGLHTRHPYESPEAEGEALEYISALRYPVKVDESGIVISFLEVVLVEPGESGSVYGSEDFFDYVVVEASRNKGADWFPLAPGYDSRMASDFLNAWNGSVNGGNSTFNGREDMYIRRTIDIRTFEKFSKGDTLMIRFRLFSDPYAYGWGWGIDDLSIKSVASATDDRIADSGIRIYPNPGNGLIRIDWPEASGRAIEYRITSISGILTDSGKIQAGDQAVIDISYRSPGIYILTLRSGDMIRNVRYIIMR